MSKTTEPRPDLVEAARAICRELGVDPDAVTSSAYAAPAQWELFLPHARAAGAAFAAACRALAETARVAAMANSNALEAERLKARADALHEAAGRMDERSSAKVIEFRRK